MALPLSSSTVSLPSYIHCCHHIQLFNYHYLGAVSWPRFILPILTAETLLQHIGQHVLNLKVVLYIYRVHTVILSSPTLSPTH
jgi:hypothetical protein